MDFARKQLEKYGWKDGQGLGKHENGITTAIKAKLKFDNAGMGHNRGEEFTNNWWENIYNQSTKNVKVHADNEKTEFSVNNPVKNIHKKKVKRNYGNFLKTSVLTEKGEVRSRKDEAKVASVATAAASAITSLTDDELFAACSGRTAHKGARHGMKLNGKLKRLQEQESAFLKNQKLN